MKLLALVVLALLAPRALVRFEKDGVVVGDERIQGTAFELKRAGASSVLASGSALEALSSSVDVELASERTLTLEPGLRLSRDGGGYRVASHGNARIRFESSGASILVAQPVRVETTPEGWRVGDTALVGSSLRAGLQAQDDTKDNLDRMLQAKQRLSPGVPKLSSRTVRLYKGNPLTSAEAVDSVSVTQLPRVSPDGAP